MLTGKYNIGEAPAADTRAGRGDKRMHDVEFREESIAVAKQIAAHAQAKGIIAAADFALAWVLNNQLVPSAIAGPRHGGTVGRLHPRSWREARFRR